MTRVALVTGGVSGIGAAICHRLKSGGYTVIANYFGNDDTAKAFSEETGIPVRAWNVADFAACQSETAAIEAEFGPIDLLVNNAGITRDSTLHKMTEEQWKSVIEVDLGGCFNMCRAVIEGMRERRFGRIVNISSVNGQSGQFGQTNYSAAKAGVIGFTKALALEGASRNITVNAVAPGYTETAMVEAVPQKVLDTIVAGVPVGRLATPDEIARGVMFLLEDDAGFITGATLPINGGKYLA
ncbi:acetoacetyl-CoA reductase [Amorphus sp. 3PC139-8]|uniref:acetoacetyl-CoA reductase n=1 Tax=Amorphus sp. 3PC139-8 TaxID=2735676 RepID=UPI00345D57E7